MLTLGCLLERLQEMTEEELKQSVTIYDGVARREVGMVFATSTDMNGKIKLEIAFPATIRKYCCELGRTQ